MNFRKTFIFILLTSLATRCIVAQQFLDETLLYEGEIREYRIYIPASYDGSTSFPLMFNFHGGGGVIAGQVAIADMRPLADTSNFIVVYPQAFPDPNDGGSNNWLHKDPSTIDDVFFVDEMINTISSQYSIDAERIYACGYSLGGEFCFELACRLNDRIAAVGIVARTMGNAAFDNCAPTHPTGIITILGTDDFISPYEGLIWNGIQFYLSAEETHNYWTTINNTSAQATVTLLPDLNPSDGSTVEFHSWENGDGCVTVDHLKVLGGGHDWPGSFGNMDIDATEEIWNYVSRFNLDGLIASNITSVDDTNSESVIVYPNPTFDEVKIDMLDSYEPADFKVYNPAGTLLNAGIIFNDKTSVPLHSLDAGVYLIEIKTKTKTFVHKIIKL